MSNKSKFVLALVGFLAMAIVAGRQLVRDPSAINIVRERSYLWFAVAAGVMACLAAGLMSYFFNRHEKGRWSKAERNSIEPVLGLAPSQIFPMPAPAPYDAKRWALTNPWLSEMQSDDRLQMDGSVMDSGEPPPGQRAFARRTHQLRFKKWSQSRHD